MTASARGKRGNKWTRALASGLRIKASSQARKKIMITSLKYAIRPVTSLRTTKAAAIVARITRAVSQRCRRGVRKSAAEGCSLIVEMLRRAASLGRCLLYTSDAADEEDS